MSSHVTGLESWHKLIRSQTIPYTIDCLLHVDSHPDLVACTTPMDWDDMENGYVMLQESLGGIAEWITPALAQMHTQKIVWMKKKNCDQLKCGKSKFIVGRNSGTKRIQVTSKEPYFMDEPQAVCGDVRELDGGGVEVELWVVELGEFDVNEFYGFLGKQWMLDVCLDYFACANPFLSRVCARVGGMEGEALKSGLLNVRWRARYETERCMGDGMPRSQVEEDEKAVFEQGLQVLFEAISEEVDVQEWEVKLMQLYDDPKQAKGFFQACVVVRSKAAAMEAHELAASPALPHHPTLDVEDRDRFGEFLKSFPKPPCAVLIAKSDEDEYTPKPECQALEEWTINAIKQTWGEVEVFDADSGSF